MLRWIGPFAALALVLQVGCAQDVKSKRITTETAPKVLDEIKTSTALTVEEVQLLQAYLVRVTVASKLAGGKPVDTTIGGAITEQRQWVADEKKRVDEEAQRRAAAQAKADAERKSLQDALRVTLYEKGFADLSYDDQITLKFEYQNTRTKDIRGFQGTAVFRNLFGDEIHRARMTEDDPIKAGETVRVSRSLDYNRFVDAHQRLRSTSLENLKVEWVPSTILFTDGSKLAVTEP